MNERKRRVLALDSVLLGGRGDTVAPTVAITSAAVSPVIAAFSVTITFSEVVTGFEAGDITVGNGTAGDFATSDNIVFTANITPTAGGDVTVDVDAGVCTDLAGNANTAATQYSITYYALKIYDAFTDTNNTLLSAHTIAPTNVPSATWTNVKTASGRNLQVLSNRADPVSAGGEGMYALEAGAFDVVLTVVLRPESTTVVQWVLLRMDNLTDALAERNCWSIRFGNGKVELYEHNASAGGTLRATANMTTAAGTDYAIKAVCVGNTITVTVDGANQISYTGITTHLTSTKFGMYIIGDLAKADDFKVFFS